MIKKVIAAIAVVFFCGLGYVYNQYSKFSENHIDTQKVTVDFITNLDHDINVSGATLICDKVFNGTDVWVGPTGWPWGDPVQWEVALWEDEQFYYSRQIYHEWCLWWSWDDPYIVVKFPKSTTGDLKGDEKLRWQVLWDILHATGRTYIYEPYIKNKTAKIERINGHTVTIGNNTFKYEKYLVLSDSDFGW